MYKPDSLRAAFCKTLPKFKSQPDTLELWIENGSIVATSARTASFEYRYTLNILFKEFSGDADIIMLTLISWAKIHQPDILENYNNHKDSITFEVDQINHETADILIRLLLRESVVVSMDETTTPPKVTITHPQVEQVEHWELWLKDEKLMEWDTRPEGWPQV